MTNKIAVGGQVNRLVLRNQSNKYSSSKRYEVDTTRLISGETPTPAVDGVETLFTLANGYVGDTLHVTRGSLRLHPTTDYAETSPSAGTFTTVVAPAVGEPLICDYIKSN